MQLCNVASQHDALCVQAREGYEMQEQEKVDEAAQRKDKGNELFKQNKFGRASKKYKKAIDLIDFDSKFEGELKARSRDIKKGANLNLAACHLRLKQYKDAKAACDKVIHLHSYLHSQHSAVCMKGHVPEKSNACSPEQPALQ